MKLQTIFILTGLAAGLMTVSCQSSGTDNQKTDRDNDYYSMVNAHIDRRLNEFNEKEEAKLPIFSSKEVKEKFMGVSFIKASEQIDLLSMDFTGPQEVKMNVLFDRASRTFTRTIGEETETYTFKPFSNGVPPAIPYDAHILYAFVMDFNRIAETVSLRSYEKLEKGENPGIAQLENEANLDEKGRKKNKNFVEIKPKVTYEPIEFRIDNRWCKCYDVKLKSICAPATALALYVSNEENTLSRVDVIFDDDSKKSFIIDWREYKDEKTNSAALPLPRVIRRLSDNAVYFREDANVIWKGQAPEQEEEPVAEVEAEGDSTSSGFKGPAEEDMLEFDASEKDSDNELEDSSGIDFEEDDGLGED